MCVCVARRRSRTVCGPIKKFKRLTGLNMLHCCNIGQGSQSSLPLVVPSLYLSNRFRIPPTPTVWSIVTSASPSVTSAAPTAARCCAERIEGEMPFYRAATTVPPASAVSRSILPPPPAKNSPLRASSSIGSPSQPAHTGEGMTTRQSAAHLLDPRPLGVGGRRPLHLRSSRPRRSVLRHAHTAHGFRWSPVTISRRRRGSGEHTTRRVRRREW